MKSARSRKEIYGSRSRRSKCRGRKYSMCTRKFGCMRAKGTKRRFCRKSSSRRIGYVRQASLVTN